MTVAARAPTTMTATPAPSVVLPTPSTTSLKLTAHRQPQSPAEPQPHPTTPCRWRSGDWPGSDGHLVVDAPAKPGVDLRHAIHGLDAPDQRRSLTAALHLTTQPDDSVADLDLDRAVGDAELPADNVVVNLPADRRVGPQEHLEQIAAGHHPRQPATGVHHRQALDVQAQHQPDGVGDQRAKGDTVHRRGHHLARAGAGGLVEALAVAGGVNRAGVGGAVRVALL